MFIKTLGYVPCLILFMLAVILTLCLISVPSVHSFVLGLELYKGGGALGAPSPPSVNNLLDTNPLQCGLLYYKCSSNTCALSLLLSVLTSGCYTLFLFPFRAEDCDLGQ